MHVKASLAGLFAALFPSMSRAGYLGSTAKLFEAKKRVHRALDMLRTEHELFGGRLLYAAARAEADAAKQDLRLALAEWLAPSGYVLWVDFGIGAGERD